MTGCAAVQLYCHDQSVLRSAGPQHHILNMLICIALISFVVFVCGYVTVRAALLKRALAFVLWRVLRRSCTASLPAGDLSVQHTDRGGATPHRLPHTLHLARCPPLATVAHS